MYVVHCSGSFSNGRPFSPPQSVLLKHALIIEHTYSIKEMEYMVAVLACVTSDQLGQPYWLQCMVGHTYVRPCVYRADKLKVECTSLCGARSCSPNNMFNMHHVLWPHSLRKGCKMRSFCLYEHLSDQCM